MSSKIKFIFKESFRGLLYARTPLMLSSLTISISLVVISILLYGFLLSGKYGAKLTEDYRMEVFFNSDLSIEESKILFTDIRGYEEIISGNFIDKKQSSDIFKHFFNQDIDSLLGENPLPFSARYVISDENKSLDSLKKISSKINKIEGVESVEYDKEILLRAMEILYQIEKILLIIIFCAVIISVILVSNTTRLMIHSKKENIKIISLMGATNTLIRMPFLIEGIIQGVLGSLISLLLLFSLKTLIEYIFVPISINYDTNLEIIIILNFIIGSILGLIGSQLAVSRYIISKDKELNK